MWVMLSNGGTDTIYTMADEERNMARVNERFELEQTGTALPRHWMAW